ncbi:MAG: lactate utilization protein, partial [Desulfamplus sp.]|nr:lactate utilization protein [Desulfamplus sp.]
LLKDSLRKYTNGIDMGITFADFGIAETGTIVVSSDSEDKRLSTMISEIHVALLYKSNIRPTALDMADELSALTSKPSSYTAFITGPSRTADIERVLAIGVHGPLELHIILLEDKE